MPYLICEKCGKIFKLKEGESPKDFECECVEKLRFVQDFGAHFDEELDPINEFNICPNCGKILEGEFCNECGLKPKTPEKSKRKQNTKK